MTATYKVLVSNELLRSGEIINNLPDCLRLDAGRWPGPRPDTTILEIRDSDAPPELDGEWVDLTFRQENGEGPITVVSRSVWSGPTVAPYMRAVKTREQFEHDYAKASGVTVEWLHEHGRHAELCTCDDELCEGWQMSHADAVEVDNSISGTVVQPPPPITPTEVDAATSVDLVMRLKTLRDAFIRIAGEHKETARSAVPLGPAQMINDAEGNAYLNAAHLLQVTVDKWSQGIPDT